MEEGRHFGKNYSNIIFTVEDNGIGIKKSVMPLLFSLYERGAKEAKMIAGGSGIGLYLARKLIEINNGKIWAESEGENKGSRFSFSLPV